jgi:hypothetical protein
MILAFVLLAYSDPSAREFSFTSFNSTSYTLLDTSGLPTQPAGVLRLTDARTGQLGTAWFNQKVLVRGFRTQFQLLISNTTADHPNGMALVLQSEGAPSQGVGGGGIGYGDVNTPGVEKGIIDSISIEFDTHCDNDTSGPNALSDPNDNHVSVHSRGPGVANSADQAYALFQNATSTAINPLWGVVQTVTVEFTPDYLAVSIAPLTGAVLNLTQVAVDKWMAIDAYGAAYIGFTASTGSTSGETFDVLSWSYSFLGVATPSRCVVYGTGQTTAVAGDWANVTLQLVDQWGFNYTDSAGLVVTGVLAAPPQIVNVTYVADGVYTIAYNATLAGATSLTVTLNGVSVAGERACLCAHLCWNIPMCMCRFAVDSYDCAQCRDCAHVRAERQRDTGRHVCRRERAVRERTDSRRVW